MNKESFFKVLQINVIESEAALKALDPKTIIDVVSLSGPDEAPTLIGCIFANDVLSYDYEAKKLTLRSDRGYNFLNVILCK